MNKILYFNQEMIALVVLYCGQTVINYVDNYNACLHLAVVGHNSLSNVFTTIWNTYTIVTIDGS